MSIDAMSWAWSLQDITSTEKLILLSYADRAGESMEAWPSSKRLELDTCLCANSIDKGRKSLIKKGYMIKTGEEKNQVHVYRLLGVELRENRTKNTNIKQPPPNMTPPKNGGTTPPKYEGGTPPKYGIQNPKKNPKRNPKGKNLSFSSFSSFLTPLDFENFVREKVTNAGSKFVDIHTKEVIYYADKFKDKRDQVESVLMSLKSIKNGSWKTPHGFNGITTKSIKEKEDRYEKEKQEQQQEDAKINRAIKSVVKKAQSGVSVNAIKSMFAAVR